MRKVLKYPTSGGMNFFKNGSAFSSVLFADYSTSLDMNDWTKNEKLYDKTTRSIPSIVNYSGKIHMVHVGKSSNDLWHAEYDGADWTDDTKIQNQTSKDYPAIDVFDGKIHMVHQGNSSNNLWHSTFTNSTGWTDDEKIDGQKSQCPPALASFNGKLHMVHQGDSSNDLWHSTFTTRNGWTDDEKISGQKSKAPPALKEFRGNLHMVHIGDSSNDIWFSSYREVQNALHLSTNEREQLIAKYAPKVYFHPDETAFPSSIDWYLPQVELRHNNTVLVSKPNLNMNNLISQRVGGELSGGPFINKNFYTKIVDDETRKGDLNSAKCYVHIRRAPTSNAIDVQYWFFYPDNPYNFAGIGNHEGDWEHITVRVKNHQHRLLGVYYAIHTHGMWTTSPHLTGSHSVGYTHPKVFSAKGSHASYPQYGSFDVDTPGPGDFNPNDDDTSDQGDTWLTRFKTVDVGTRHNIRNNQDWLRFTGTWGASRGAGPSPETPSFKDRWEDDGGGPLDFRT